MKKQYIPQSLLPPRLSILEPILMYMILERFGAPLWAYGVIYTLYALGFVVLLIKVFTWESVDVFEELKKRR